MRLFKVPGHRGGKKKIPEARRHLSREKAASHVGKERETEKSRGEHESPQLDRRGRHARGILEKGSPPEGEGRKETKISAPR